MRPEIGFKGFTDDWEQRKLGKVCDFINGDRSSNYPNDADFQDSGIPFVGSDSLGFTFVNRNKLRFISCEKYEQMRGLKIQNKDILYTLRGAGFGKCSISDFFDGTVASSLVGIRCNEEELEPYFFVQWLNSTNAENEKKKAVNGSTAQNISVEDMKKYMICLPLHEEQQKIGTYFHNLDHIITLHQRKYERLVNVKKSMLVKMFPQNGSKVPEIRFKGFTNDWEQRKLEDVIDICSGRDYKHLDDGDIPVYGTGGYMLCVSEALSYDEDAIGIGRKGTIDKPYILKAPFWTVDTLFYCIPKANNDINFMYDIFQNINWKAMDESTGVPSLSKIAINKVEILTTTLAEQQQIGTYFQQLDKLITLYQRKIKKLQDAKKAFLTKMFV